MAELRWLIVLFGVLFVVGVYLAMRRQDGRRGSSGVSAERQEPVLGAGQALGDHEPWEDLRREPELNVGDEELQEYASDSGEGLGLPDRDTPAYLRKREEAGEPSGAGASELPVVTVGKRVAQVGDAAPPQRPPRRAAEQLELGVADAPDEADESTEALEGDPPAPEIEEVFTLRLVPRSGDAFAGDAVGQGLLTAGLSRGRFDVFHYVPTGTTQAVFSIANLVEPGTLRDEDLAGQALPGLTIFMLLPGPLSGTRALEEMITCARLLANYLDAVVQDDTGGSLTRQTEEHLRERVVDFEHRRARGER